MPARSESEYEYVDTFNDLRFVLSERRGGGGVLRYRVAVRRADNGDPFVRGVVVGSPAKTAQREGFLATCTFPLTNSGQAGAGMFDSDVYRLAATSSSADWKVTLPNALAAAKAAETVQVPVHVLRDPLTDDGDARTVVTLTATSESDASKTATRTCNVHVRDDAGRRLVDRSRDGAVALRPCSCPSWCSSSPRAAATTRSPAARPTYQAGCRRASSSRRRLLRASRAGLHGGARGRDAGDRERAVAPGVSRAGLHRELLRTLP